MKETGCGEEEAVLAEDGLDQM